MCITDSYIRIIYCKYNDECSVALIYESVCENVSEKCILTEKIRPKDFCFIKLGEEFTSITCVLDVRLRLKAELSMLALILILNYLLLFSFMLAMCS